MRSKPGWVAGMFHPERVLLLFPGVFINVFRVPALPS
jgi:hypothetical protein